MLFFTEDFIFQIDRMREIKSSKELSQRLFILSTIKTLERFAKYIQS